jgi:hypothetical protein
VAIVNYNPKDPGTRYFWVSFFGQNNRIDHTRFTGQNHSGVTIVVWRKSGVRDGYIMDQMSSRHNSEPTSTFDLPSPLTLFTNRVVVSNVCSSSHVSRVEEA